MQNVKILKGAIEVEGITGYVEDTHFRLFISTREKYVGVMTTSEGVMLFAEAGHTRRNGEIIIPEGEPEMELAPTMVVLPWTEETDYSFGASTGRYTVEVIGVAANKEQMDASLPTELEEY